MGVSRRTFLRNSLAALSGAALPLAGYAEFIEPHHLTVERLEFRITNLPEAFDGFRIVQLSDFHFGDFIGEKEVRAAVDLANSLKPDLVALTGDFITCPGPTAATHVTNAVYANAAICARTLSALDAPLGAVACLGNHDVETNGPYIAEVLSDFHIKVLRNSSYVIERERERLWIAGVDDGVFGDPDFAKCVRTIPAKEPTILLAHEPDLADEAAKHGFAVQLSGHSHGGQIRLPVVGAMYLPTLGKRYPFGYYRIGNMQLYTNRGVGMIVLPYRFNAPPEVTLITLRVSRR